MGRNDRFVHTHHEVDEAIDKVDPLDRDGRYAAAFRALITSIDSHIRLSRLDGDLLRFWKSLVFILNKIDERITAEAVGGEEL